MEKLEGFNFDNNEYHNESNINDELIQELDLQDETVDDMDFVNGVLDSYDIDNDETKYKSFDEIKDKREEVLYYIYENYLQVAKNQYRLAHYLESMEDYEYIEDPSDIMIGDYVRYVDLTDLDDITIKRGGIVANIVPTQSGEYMIRFTSGTRDAVWCKKMDNIFFRKMNEDQKLNASIMQMFGDILQEDN